MLLYLDLNQIHYDKTIQPRERIKFSHVKRLEKQLKKGSQLEPIITFYDGHNYWLASGFHRFQAYKNQNYPTIPCILHIPHVT